MDHTIIPSGEIFFNGNAYSSSRAIAAALHATRHPEFINYQRSILYGAQALASVLKRLGLRLVTNGTDNHMVLVDLTLFGVRGNM